MDRLVVRGAREHNLKDVHLDLPRDALIVFTGLSGSGQVEPRLRHDLRRGAAPVRRVAVGLRPPVPRPDGQARRRLHRGPVARGLDRPEVDQPQPAVDGRHDHRGLRLPAAALRAGRSAALPELRQADLAADAAADRRPGARRWRRAPGSRCSRRSSARRKGEYVDLFSSLQTQGFSRVRVDGVVHPLTEPPKLKKQEKHTIEVVVDRLTVKESAKRRLTDSVETALGLAGGLVVLDFVDLAEHDPHRERTFSEHLACVDDGLSFEALEPRSFSFNSPFGACPECTGIGTRKEVDPELVIPDPEKSLAQGAVAPWASSMSNEYFLRLLTGLAQQLGFSMDTPWEQLPAKVQKAVLHGSPDQVHVRYKNRYGRERSYYAAFEGVMPFLERRHEDTDSDWARDKYEGYMRDVPCPVCHGTRLKPEILAVKLNGRSIAEVTNLSIGEASEWLDGLELGERERAIADRVLKEIQARLSFLVDVGLDYLSLDRPAATLAGGEAQRIRLATQIGSGPGRRPLRPRRALDRAAPAGQHPADRDPDPAARHGQHAHRRRARRGHHQGRRLDRRHRPGRGRARRRDRRQRPARRPDEERALADRGVPVRAQGDRDPQGAARADAGARARSSRAPASTTSRASTSRSRWAAWWAVTGVSGSGKSSLVNDILYTTLANQLNRARMVPGPAPDGHRPGAPGQGRARRPVADRPHPAVEPGDLHRRLGPRPQAVRQHHRGEDARATCPAGSRSTSRAGAARRAPATAR